MGDYVLVAVTNDYYWLFRVPVQWGVGGTGSMVSNVFMPSGEAHY